MASTPAQLAIATLYSAAFNRAPDADGFDFWLAAYGRGASMTTLAETFLGTPEGNAAYPAAMSSQAFVAAFYTSVFGRPADAQGLAFWSSALDALGGANDASAKAALMVNIIGVASTPLDGKPDGVSDEAYAQTVADRARFINKAEVGVHFAAELRSNDLSLAKQVLALVTADPASVNTANTFADQTLNPPVTPPVTPPAVVPALTSADDATTIASKLAAYTGTDASANTTGMGADQLKALVAGMAKFKADGLTGTPVFSSDLLPTEVLTLLGKYSGSTATVDAVDFTSAELASLSDSLTKLTAIQQPSLELADTWLTSSLLLAMMGKSVDAQLHSTGFQGPKMIALLSSPDNVANLADNGLTGDLYVPSLVSADVLDLLFQKTTTSSMVTVEAGVMVVDELVSLFKHADKVDDVRNLSVLSGVWAELPSDIGTLFSKGTSIRVDLTGASTDQLKGVAAYTSYYAVDGLTGSYTLDRNLNSDQLGALLDNRVATAATVTVQAIDMDGAQLRAVARGIVKADEIVGLSLDNAKMAELTLVQIGSLLSKATDAHVDASNMNASILAVVAANADSLAAGGLTGALTIDSTISASDAFLLLDKYDGTIATVDASLFTGTQLQGLYDRLDKLSTVTQPKLDLFQAWLDASAVDALLAKSSDAKVAVTTGTDNTQLAKLVANLSHVGAGGIEGTMSLDSSTASASDLQALLQKTGPLFSADVNAATMGVDQIVVLFNFFSTVSTVDNLSVPAAVWASLPSNTGELLSKGFDITLDVTGASADQLKMVAIFTGHYADNGVTGTFALSSYMGADALNALMGSKVDASTTISVDAASMNADQVVALFGNADKIDFLSNLSGPSGTMALLANVTSDIGRLLLKTGGNALDLTGATTSQLYEVARFWGQFKSDGLTGSFTISKDLDVGLYQFLLSDKAADAANVTIDATGMSNDQLTAVASGIGKVDTITNLSLSAANLPALSVSELESLLSKATDANVEVTGLVSAKVGAVLNNLAHVANDGISGTLTITNSLAAAPLSTFFQKVATGATLTVNAASMDVDQVLALFANAGKIDSLSNLSVPSGTMARLTGDLGTLFQKGTGIKVDLSGASVAQVNDAAKYLSQYASEGLTGTYTIDKSMPQELFVGLLDATDSAANVTVEADGMSVAQVFLVITRQLKVDAFKQLSLSASDVSPFYMYSSTFSQILAKSTDLKLEVNSLESANLDSLVSSLSHIADAGLTGTLKLSSAQFAIAGGTSLDAKLASAATVQVTGTASDDVVNLTGLSKQVYVDAGAGADLVTLGSGEGTVLIGGKIDSRSTAVVDTTQSTSASIDRVAGLKAGDVIKLSLADGVFGSGIQFTAATDLTYVEQRSQNVTVGPATFDNIYNALSGVLQTASTSALASLQIFTLTSTSGLAGKFLIINDGNEAITADDTIIELIGATDDLVFTV